MNMADILAVIGTIIALSGFLFGLYQYTKAQRWKKLEYAAKLLQEMTIDEDIALALIFLEYSKRQVPLPDKYHKLAGDSLFQHDSEKLSQMLEVGYWENTPEYFIYRDTLNRLFRYLQQFQQFIEMKLIEPEEAYLVGWVLRRITNPDYIDKKTLHAYVQYFPGVISLLQSFGYKK